MSRLKYLVALACVPLACIAFAGLAWAGTAYYGGFSDEGGVPYWTGTPTNPVLQAQNPGWKIGEDADGTEVGSFTRNDGSTTLVIPDDADGQGWVLTAEWDLPNPTEFANDHYFYIGFDPMSIDALKARLGTEWKDADGDTVKEFVIREQLASAPGFPPTGTEVPISRGSHVHIRQTCVRAGDPLIWPPNVAPFTTDAVFEEYRVNFGLWTPYTNAAAINWIPLGAYAMDAQQHYITWKVRGLGGVIDPKITGNQVPNVNTGNDHDSDGTVDENDAFPGDDRGQTDTDEDGLPDEWEMLYWSNLDQGTYDNPDGDYLDNREEWLGGTDPTVEDIVPLIGYVGAAALVTVLTAGGATALIRRKRR